MGVGFYSDEFKQMAVQKLFSPNSGGLNKTATDIGIAASTLFGWKKKYGSSISMKKKDIPKSSANWSPEQKLQAIIETSSMSENELGEYLRKHGLHSTTLEEWKKALLSVFKPVGRPKKDSEVFEVSYEVPKTLSEKIGINLEAAINRIALSWWSRSTQEKNY